MTQLATDPAGTLPRLGLVLGGARSGKSAYAERLIAEAGGGGVYLATAEAGDDEMRARIAAHKRRRGDSWHTIEEPLDIVRALDGHAAAQPLLLDCLTLWLSNLLAADRDPDDEFARLDTCLAGLRGPALLVSNEVGFGIVPDNALARRFRDLAGRLNQLAAARAEQVVLVAAGLPLRLK